MAFIVCFINNHETILVTQLIEHGSIGIVTGTNSIEVVLFNHLQVPLHMLNTDDRAGDRVGVVTVNTTELDRVAVKEHHIVLNMDRTEADAVSDDFIRGFQNQGVQVRLLGVPECRILNSENCLMCVSTAIECLNNTGANSLFRCIQQLDFCCNKLSIVCEPDTDSGFFIFHQCCGEVIPDAVFGTLQDIYITEDAGSTELVLIFQVAAIAPLQNHNRQGVLAFSDGLSNIKLGGGVRNFTVAQECTIQPHIEAGVNTFKVQVCFRCICIAFVDKIVQICTAGILIRNIGRICGERITNVGILVPVIAMILPDAGNRNHVPGRRIIILFVEKIFKIVNALTVLKLPIVIQQLESIGMLTVLYQVVHSARCRNKVTSVRGGAYMVGMQVFINGRNNHSFLLRYLFFLDELLRFSF